MKLIDFEFVLTPSGNAPFHCGFDDILDYAPIYGFENYNPKNNFKHIPFHLHIVSVNGIKSGDYIVNQNTNSRFSKGVHKVFHSPASDSLVFHSGPAELYVPKSARKVIASTDKSLGLPEIDPEVLKYFAHVNQSSVEQIVLGKPNIVDNKVNLKVYSTNEKMYSKKEVIRLLSLAFLIKPNQDTLLTDFENWIDKHL